MKGHAAIPLHLTTEMTQPLLRKFHTYLDVFKSITNFYDNCIHVQSHNSCDDTIYNNLRKSVDIIYSPSVKWASSTTLGKLWPKNQILPSINLPSILPINPKLNPSKVLLFNSKQFDVVLILVALNTIIISNLFISMIDTSVSCSTSTCKPIFLLRLTNYLLLIMLTNMLLPMKQHNVIKPKFKAMLKTWLFNPIPMVNEPPMIAHLNAQREENHIRISRS